MRIAYVIHWNEGPESGVYKKIVSQINEWSRLGNEIGLFLVTSNKALDWGRSLKGIHITAQHYNNLFSRFSSFRTIVGEADSWRPDVIYHRYDLFYPSLYRLLRRYPSVLEINSNDLTEMKFQGLFRYGYHRLTRGFILRVTKGKVFVSQELSETESYTRFTQSRIVIGNGIELDHYPHFRKPVESGTELASRRVHAVFIGSPGQIWHGVDKIVLLAKCNPDWLFDMVGILREDLSEHTQTNDELPNMVFHGRLTKEQYEPIMQRASLAIGSLAMHRTRLEEGSPLKVREYLAYGLPVIIGYKETDFPEGSPFILQLPNENDNIKPHLDSIRAFVMEWSEKRVARHSIHHLDTKLKEVIRVSYMRQLSGRGESP